jgi:hypothetical protein
MSLEQTVRTRIVKICMETDIYKNGYEPGTKLIDDENYNLFADCHNILNSVA